MIVAISRVIAAVAALLSGAPDATSTEPWQRRDSPFVLGEVLPETTPATCASVKHCVAKAPQVDDRVSFAIVGRLVSAEWDGTLAYLIMCAESDIQVMCVTYSKEGRDVGDTVLFAGGYSRVGERAIVLDPCLASPAE